jgi:glycine/D-amino acid oxidase-like deaminating enzyme
MNRNLSYWESEYILNSSDVIIVGAGIVGLTSAYWILKSQPKLNVTILERSPIPYGATTRNAGFACFGSLSELYEMIKIGKSIDEVFSLVERRYNGLGLLLSEIEDIGFSQCGNYEIFTKNEKTLFDDSIHFMDTANTEIYRRFGIENNYKLSNESINAFGFQNVENLISSVGEGTINTGKLFNSLYRNATKLGTTILTGVEVQSYNGTNLETNIGIFKSHKLLFATDGFSGKFFPNEINPYRVQVAITNQLENIPFNGGFHFDRGYFFFREIDSRILIGGGRHHYPDSENTNEMSTTENIQGILINLLKTVVFPNKPFTIDMKWAGILGMGAECGQLPIIKEVEPNVYIAIRTSGMGVALGSAMGKDAAELILS